VTLASPALLAVGLLVAAALGAGAVAVSRRRAAALAAAGVAGPGRARQAGLWLTIAGIVVLAIAVAGPAASLPVPRASGTEPAQVRGSMVSSGCFSRSRNSRTVSGVIAGSAGAGRSDRPVGSGVGASSLLSTLSG